MYVLAIAVPLFHWLKCQFYPVLQRGVMLIKVVWRSTSGTTIAPGGPVPERWSWYHAAWMVVPSGTRYPRVGQLWLNTPEPCFSRRCIHIWDMKGYIYVYLHSAFNIRGMGLEVESRFPFNVRHKSFCLAGVTWNWRCSMLWILVGYVQEMCPRPCSNDFTCNARCSELSWRK